ncbi:MAG: hypothetical protein WA972_04390 [Rhodococcus qingshengii]
MTGVDVERTKALAEKAQLGHLVAVTSGVRNGDHWYICDDNESVAMIAANDGIDEELRQPRAELFAHAVNTLPALVAEVQQLRARITVAAEYHRQKNSTTSTKDFCTECDQEWPCDTRKALETKP